MLEAIAARSPEIMYILLIPVSPFWSLDTGDCTPTTHRNSLAVRKLLQTQDISDRSDMHSSIASITLRAALSAILNVDLNDDHH